MARNAECRTLSEATNWASYYAQEFRRAGHVATTARLFQPERKAALVLLHGGKAEVSRSGALPTIARAGGGAIRIWTDKKRPEYLGQLPFVSNCLYCGGQHIRNAKGGYACDKGRFVETIVNSFPSLRGAPHRMPWSATKFATWARTSPSITSGSHHAACCVLAIWAGESGEFPGLRFDAVRAMGSWDSEHRRAWLTWVANPWNP